MGIIISKFRKEKSTEQILEALEKEINDIEIYQVHTERKRKKIVGSFVLMSLIIYAGTAFIFYFYFFPVEMYDRIFFLVPLILAPAIIFFTKKGLTWYYNHKISRRRTRLSALNEEKTQLLETVMDKETYKVAKKILERFAPEQIPKNSFPATSLETPKRNQVVSFTPSMQNVRQRAPIQQMPISRDVRSSMVMPQTPSRQLMHSPQVAGIKPSGTPSVVMDRSSTIPLPRPGPIIPRERSVFDRLVDYLVGDGPSNRYALICKRCSSHNGMALKDEFEYISFICYYCNTLNAARKQRIVPPKIQITESTPPPFPRNTTESDTSSSTTEDENEWRKKPAESGDLNKTNPFIETVEDDSRDNGVTELSDTNLNPFDEEDEKESQTGILAEITETFDSHKKTE